MGTPEATPQGPGHRCWRVSDPLQRGSSAWRTLEKPGHCATLICKEQGSPWVDPRAVDDLASWKWQAAVATKAGLALCTSHQWDIVNRELWPAGGSGLRGLTDWLAISTHPL